MGRGWGQNPPKLEQLYTFFIENDMKMAVLCVNPLQMVLNPPLNEPSKYATLMWDPH